MRRVMIATLLLFSVLVISVSQASAITVISAEVQNGTAIVSGIKASGGVNIYWQNIIVAKSNKGGRFQFQASVPPNCIGTLSDGYDTVAVTLTNCVPAPQPAARVLKTGQTQCWWSNELADCTGTGQDGELQMGAARSYTDNGDGTITDNTTRLMWEKLTSDSSIHDVSNRYSFCGGLQKAKDLNAMSFAGYTDWRLRNINELQSLAYYKFEGAGVSGFPEVAIDPVFNSTSNGSYTNTSYPYLSSTTSASTAYNLNVIFADGTIVRGYKWQTPDWPVRCVRTK